MIEYIDSVAKLPVQAVSWAFTILAIWGLIAFYPRRKDRGDNGPSYLIQAIWVGFLGGGLNAFYWRVFSELALYFEWFTITQIRWFGSVFGDVLWKGAGAVSIYLHFFARWKFLSEKERKIWSPLLMGWYPNEKHLVVRTLRRLNSPLRKVLRR